MTHTNPAIVQTSAEMLCIIVEFILPVVADAKWSFKKLPFPTLLLEG